MKSKHIIFISCLAAMALMVSPVLGEPQQSRGERAMISAQHPTAHMARNYPRYSGSRYSGSWRSGTNWRHHRFGNRFYFYGGYPYIYGWYPYYWGSPWRDRKSTRLNSSHVSESRMPSSACKNIKQNSPPPVSPANRPTSHILRLGERH